MSWLQYFYDRVLKVIVEDKHRSIDKLSWLRRGCVPKGEALTTHEKAVNVSLYAAIIHQTSGSKQHRCYFFDAKPLVSSCKTHPSSVDQLGGGQQWIGSSAPPEATPRRRPSARRRVTQHMGPPFVCNEQVPPCNYVIRC